MESTSPDFQIIRGFTSPGKEYLLRRVGYLDATDTPLTIQALLPSWAATQKWKLTLATGQTTTVETNKWQQGIVLAIVTTNGFKGGWCLDICVTPKHFAHGAVLSYVMQQPGPETALLKVGHDQYCREGCEPIQLDARRMLRDLFCVTAEEAECIMDCVNDGLTIYDLMAPLRSLVRGAVLAELDRKTPD